MPEAAQRNDTDKRPGAESRLSSDALPERDRVTIFREVYGRQIMRIEMEPLPGSSFRVDMAVRTLPGLALLSTVHSPMRVMRTQGLIADGDDRIVLQINDTASLGWQSGREVMLAPRDSIALSNADAGSVTFPRTGSLFSLLLTRNELGPLLRDVNECIGRPVPGSTPALRLLMGYLEILKDDSATAGAELCRLAVAHVYDLVALVLGATRDAAELAKGRGVRAAHLHAIKKQVVTHLDGDLHLDDIAALRRLSARYVRMLFEAEGTTFTEFVREERLLRAYRMLNNQRNDHRRICDIAYDTGFNDLSYFNRTFRRRFGISPGEVRRASMKAP